jgi:hypothetical protein
MPKFTERINTLVGKNACYVGIEVPECALLGESEQPDSEPWDARALQAYKGEFEVEQKNNDDSRQLRYSCWRVWSLLS